MEREFYLVDHNDLVFPGSAEHEDYKTSGLACNLVRVYPDFLIDFDVEVENARLAGKRDDFLRAVLGFLIGFLVAVLVGVH